MSCDSDLCLGEPGPEAALLRTKLLTLGPILGETEETEDAVLLPPGLVLALGGRESL